MQVITKNLKQLKLAKKLMEGARIIRLPFLERSKSRQSYLFEDGEKVLINLPRGGVMRGGDILVDEDGKFYLVSSLSENILKVSSPNRLNLLRAAYHLGNRHIPIEVGLNYLHLEEDPVLADMLKQLGVEVTKECLPFEPEHGAYGGGHKHGHDESFAEDYAVAQRVFESHQHAHHQHPHDHDHDHSH
jgi:urease accessory protein